MPKLEDVHKEYVKKFGEEPLTEKGIQRYRRVLGQLAWAALSRADLSFPISFSLEISGQTQSCRRTVYACVPEMVVRESPLCATACQQLNAPTPEKQKKLFHFVTLHGDLTQFQEPSWFTEGVV